MQMSNAQTLRALDALESSDYAKASREVQEAFLHGFYNRYDWRQLDLKTAPQRDAWECGMASGMKPAPIKPN